MSQGSCSEAKPELNQNSVDDDIRVSFCNERPLLVAEFAVVENTRHFGAVHYNRVVWYISVDEHVVCALIQHKGVINEVVTLSIRANIWDC